MIIVTNGFISDGRNITATQIACKFIGDKKEVLTFNSGEISIGVKYDEVEKLIKRARRKKDEIQKR